MANDTEQANVTRRLPRLSLNCSSTVDVRLHAYGCDWVLAIAAAR